MSKKHQPSEGYSTIQGQVSDLNAIVCPFCNGSGCQNCQNSGQLEVSSQELAQLQAIMQTPIPGTPPNIPLTVSQATALKQKIKRETIPGSRITFREIKTKTAGLIALLITVALIAGAYISQKHYHSFRPYLAIVSSVLVLSLVYLFLKI